MNSAFCNGKFEARQTREQTVDGIKNSTASIRDGQHGRQTEIGMNNSSKQIKNTDERPKLDAWYKVIALFLDPTHIKLVLVIEQPYAS